MKPYEFYRGIYGGTVYTDAATFLKAFRLCTAYARHIMHPDAKLDVTDQSVLYGLCQAADLLKPFTKDVFVTSESVGGVSLKLDFSDLPERVHQALALHLPNELFYRGVCKIV